MYLYLCWKNKPFICQKHSARWDVGLSQHNQVSAQHNQMDSQRNECRLQHNQMDSQRNKCRAQHNQWASQRNQISWLHNECLQNDGILKINETITPSNTSNNWRVFPFGCLPCASLEFNQRPTYIERGRRPLKNPDESFKMTR